MNRILESLKSRERSISDSNKQTAMAKLDTFYELIELVQCAKIDGAPLEKASLSCCVATTREIEGFGRLQIRVTDGKICDARIITEQAK